MSLEVSGIGQQLAAMDRRLEGSVNSTLRTTSAALQTSAQSQEIENEQQAASDKTKASEFVQQMQTISSMFDRKLQFRINDDLNRVVVKVIDSSTDKVIREIPSAEIQRLQIRIKEALGLLFDESI
ncbi:flagellar protein FlaG [Treponema zuelzerae]|uniref:Flagellar protein FlaG n=1 Tax=Teretinema zuelzerae TaxID=156 RepID=A0AAE3EHP7_9SPIR|nr:flagellar protein FlaG [Teretinema zuelzerae]MBN2810888.1 flagellar protein FlaG [Spirochaetales bacterium]MCD1654872.1 flagellar protein FlaG [Teretinema zuelzerae]